MNDTEEQIETGGNLKGRIEAVLYVAGDAVSIDDLSKALSVPVQ